MVKVTLEFQALVDVTLEPEDETKQIIQTISLQLK